VAGAVGESPEHTENWQILPWKQFQCNVFRLQQRIYQAVRRGDWQQVHSLQRLLLRSWSARCLAVRQVAQDNRGKRTPGVDGVARLTPEQRLALARDLRDLPGWTVDPIRRIYIPKREARAGDPYHVGQSHASIGKAGTGTGMGSVLRAQLVWISARPFSARCDRSDIQVHQPQAEVCLGN
jgi:hypothetical protein